MGHYLRLIRSILSSKYGAFDFVRSAEECYEKHKSLFPGYDPHYYLSLVWLAIKQGRGENIDDPDIRMASLTSTYLISCVHPKKCARALGLFLLYQLKPRVFERYPKLSEEFNELISPVYEAKEKGNLEILYKSFNPNMDKLEEKRN